MSAARGVHGYLFVTAILVVQILAVIAGMSASRMGRRRTIVAVFLVCHDFAFDGWVIRGASPVGG